MGQRRCDLCVTQDFVHQPVTEIDEERLQIARHIGVLDNVFHHQADLCSRDGQET